MFKKMSALTLAALLVVSLLAGCGSVPAEPEFSDKSEEIVEAAPQEPVPEQPEETPTEPANPEYPIEQLIIGTTSVIETATRDEYAYDMLASGTSEPPLVYQDTTGHFQPLLAEVTTEDAQTWTYTILDGMTWSDGEPVTAEDILFTLQYGDENGSAYFKNQTDSEGKTTSACYTDYVLSDDLRSISLTLASPNVRHESSLTSFRVMPKHIYEGNDAPTEEQQRIGCGPYLLEEFNREAGTLTFTVNPYYPAKPNVKTITYQLFSNEDTMYMALQNGDIDMIWNYSQGVPANYQDVLAGMDTISMISIASANAPAVLVFNNAKGLFTDVNLRKAAACALDYEAFKTYFGSAYAETPNVGFVPSSTIGFAQTPKLETNLEKSREYLAAAGYTEKNEEGYYVNEAGNVLSFTLTVNAGKDTHVGYAELIKTNLETAGFQVNLEALDGASYNAKTSNKFSENNITMEAGVYGFTAAGMGMGNGMGSIYVDGRHPVQGGAQVYDPAFQEIIAAMAGAKNMDAYMEAAAELQNYYAEQQPLVALYWDNMMYAYASRFDNVTIDYTFGLNNINNWFTITMQ